MGSQRVGHDSATSLSLLCFLIPLDQNCLDHLSRPSLIPDRKKTKIKTKKRKKEREGGQRLLKSCSNHCLLLVSFVSWHLIHSFLENKAIGFLLYLFGNMSQCVILFSHPDNPKPILPWKCLWQFSNDTSWQRSTHRLHTAHCVGLNGKPVRRGHLVSTEGEAAATAEAVGLSWVGLQLSGLEGEVKAL